MTEELRITTHGDCIQVQDGNQLWTIPRDRELLIRLLELLGAFG